MLSRCSQIALWSVHHVTRRRLDPPVLPLIPPLIRGASWDSAERQREVVRENGAVFGGWEETDDMIRASSGFCSKINGIHVQSACPGLVSLFDYWHENNPEWYESIIATTVDNELRSPLHVHESIIATTVDSELRSSLHVRVDASNRSNLCDVERSNP